MVKKVTVKVFGPDGSVRKRAYPSIQVPSALAEIAENLDEFVPAYKFEQVTVEGGYNFVCRGRKNGHLERTWSIDPLKGDGTSKPFGVLASVGKL
jgi:hypothetical protein